MSKGFMFTAYTYSPLHAGVGQSMGVVDQPIEREKHTNYPVVYATGLKGALRAHFSKPMVIKKIEKEKLEEELKSLPETDPTYTRKEARKESLKYEINQLKKPINRVFGEEDASAGAGGAIFTDLKILLFPVRASEGTFKWVTCQRVLDRFQKDYEIVYGSKPHITELALTKEKEDISNPFKSSTNYVILEDFIFNKPEINNDDKEKPFLCNYPAIKLKDIIKIDEDYFDYLVSHATQIIARNKLNDKKTSENLWYEEFIPTDTVMYSFVMPSVACNEDQLKSFTSDGKDFCSTLDGEIIQVGGGETVGKGIVKFSKVTDCEDENADS